MSALALEARLGVVVGTGAQRFELDAQFRLERGVLVLFGPSGAGKSLTVQALAGLISPARGAIRCPSAMSRRMSPSGWRAASGDEVTRVCVLC